MCPSTFRRSTSFPAKWAGERFVARAPKPPLPTPLPCNIGARLCLQVFRVAPESLLARLCAGHHHSRHHDRTRRGWHPHAARPARVAGLARCARVGLARLWTAGALTPLTRTSCLLQAPPSCPLSDGVALAPLPAAAPARHRRCDKRWLRVPCMRRHVPRVP